MKPDANILVLEDEPLLRLMLVSKLEQLGVKVHEADCCAAALSIARQVELDAAVFDYRVPDGTSVDLLRRLRAEHYAWPVVVLSGEAEHIASEASAELGVVAVLPKPPQIDQIEAALAIAHESTPAQAIIRRQGRYVVWDVPSARSEVPTEICQSDYLALNFSCSSVANPTEFPEFFLKERPVALAAVNAPADWKMFLSELDIAVDFVSDLEELAALSRRRTERGERRALLDSVVRRDLV